MLHLATHIPENDPPAAIRGVFNRFWAHSALRSEGLEPLSMEYTRCIEQGSVVVALLHQAGFGSPDELADRYFRDADLHAIAMSVLTPAALAAATDRLLELCAPFTGTLADCALDWLCLSGAESGSFDHHVAQRIAFSDYLSFTSGHLTQEEARQWLIRKCIIYSAPVLRDEVGLELFGGDFEPGVHRVSGRQQRGAFSLVHAVEYAGYLGPAGYVQSESVCGDDHNCDTGPHTMWVLDDTIAREMSVLSWAHFYNALGDRLSRDLSPAHDAFVTHPSMRSDSLYRWREEQVILHEEGHLLSGPRLRTLRNLLPAEMFELCRTAIEVHANAHMLNSLQPRLDRARRGFLAACCSAPATSGNPPSTDTWAIFSWLTRTYPWLERRALLEPRPGEYLFQFLDELENKVRGEVLDTSLQWAVDRVLAAERECA